MGGALPNSGQLLANSPTPETRSMSSPKPWKLLSSRCFSIGTSGRVSIDRKKRRTRADILSSRCSAAIASYIRNGSALASVSAANDSWMSGSPGMMNAPMSTFVVTPTLAEYASASSVPRF